MIGRRTAVGLSLLCALLFSAVAVQSASAAKAVNTTAFTCVKGGGPLDFEDAHCDKKGTPFEEEYGHELIPEGITTEITVDNTLTGGETDKVVLKSKAFGANTEITCNKVHGEGTLHNVLGESDKHTVTGTLTVKYTDCSVQKPLKCDVQEPIEGKVEFEGVEGLGPNKDTMGIEFKAHEGGAFGSFTYINNGAEICALKNKTVKLTGSTIGTGTPSPAGKYSGATINFDHTKITEAKSLLLEPPGFPGVAAGLDSTTTVRMNGGNPIALTTTT